MKNDLLIYALVICLLLCFSANCSKAQSAFDKTKTETLPDTDLSTDADVIAELQKIRDAENVVSTGDERLDAKRQNAGRLDAKNVRIARLKESPKIIVIGFFRTDVGYHFDGAFVNSRYYEREDSDVSKFALAALGWEKANQKERENLAKIWVEKALLVFAPLPYQKVSAVSSGDGEIKITAASEYPPNITSRTQMKQFVFNKNGSLLSANG